MYNVSVFPNDKYTRSAGSKYSPEPDSLPALSNRGIVYIILLGRPIPPLTDVCEKLFNLINKLLTEKVG